MVKAAQALVTQGDESAALSLLGYFSSNELLRGLDLVTTLSASIEARLKLAMQDDNATSLKTYNQIW